ncbi:MAG: hypothetical protein ACK5JH_05640 [Anaerocolumna sp.]
MKIVKCIGIIGCVFMFYGCSNQKQLLNEEIPKEQLSKIIPIEADEGINLNLEDKNIFINVDKNMIEIPDKFIIGLEKIYWLKNEEISTTQEELNNILKYINKSSIARLYINYEEVIKNQNIGSNEEYPILINNVANVDIRIGSLIEINNNFYVTLKIYGSKDNVKIISKTNISGNQDDQDMVLATCYLESEDLYYVVKQLWEHRIYLNEIEEVTEAEILLNEKASLKGNNNNNNISLTKEETEKLISGLKENSDFIKDTHPFGITIKIKTKKGGQIEIYYAEDGCGIFQLDGQNYIIESDSKIVKELEEFILKLQGGN